MALVTRWIRILDQTLAPAAPVVLAVLVGLVCVSASCGRSKRAKKPARPDAAVVTRTPDAAVHSPRRPDALGALLRHVPRRADWFVGLGRPAALVHGAVRFWKLLAEIPDLSAPMGLVARRVGDTLGGWPPPVTLWRDLGIDPGGGIVLAGVGVGAKRPSGTVALVLTETPQHLLKKLVGPAGVPAGSTARAALRGLGDWWCGPVSVGVACASSRALLQESVALGAKPSSQTLLARLPAHNLRGADLVGGWRGQPGAPITMATARFRSWGIGAQVRLRGGELTRWLGWLGRSEPHGPRPADAVAALWLNLDDARIAALVALLPANTIETSGPGAVSPAGLLSQCTGEVALVVGSSGTWRLRAARRVATTGLERPVRWKVSGWPVWARAPAGSLVIASTAAGTLLPWPVSGGKTTLRPRWRRVTGPAGLAMRVPLLDPMELLTNADRARLVAALAGLPAGERAFVGLLRGLLTLLGEAGLSVDKTADGALVRVSFVSPAVGSGSLQRDFDRLWRAKWQGGGFFDGQGLARMASRHPSTPLSRLAGALTGLRQGPPWSGWLTDAGLRLLRRLSGPELSCASLAARLVRCREPWARLRSPQRWREMEAGVLPAHRRRLRKSLLDEARREGRSLGAHCDRLAGRLENAPQVTACLRAVGCAEFALCLVAAFTPPK